MRPPERITRFLGRHHVMTLATAGGRKPWCASVFYVYLPEYNIFVFASAGKTRHISEVLANENVAGSIALETWKIGKIQGVQLTGKVRRTDGEGHLGKAYMKRFPYAKTMKPELWILEPELLKMTDNRLGFGKKLLWIRE